MNWYVPGPRHRYKGAQRDHEDQQELREGGMGRQ
jgi:hypothetical protein